VLFWHGWNRRSERGRDQKQMIRWRGSPAGHQASVRGACCRRLVAAQPSNVAAKIRPVPISRLFRAGRRCVFIRRRLARAIGAAGVIKIPAAVSRIASI
jgi:hypothetical protein